MNKLRVSNSGRNGLLNRSYHQLIILSAFILLLAIWAAVPEVSRAFFAHSSLAPAESRQADIVPGQILVRFRNQKTAEQEKSHRSSLSLSTQEQIPLELEGVDAGSTVPGLLLARVTPDDTFRAIEALKAMPDVLYAEPNYLFHTDAVPNDPRYSELWAFNNTGHLAGELGSDLDAELAWNITTGSSDVVVGVIDSGIDIHHEDLAANIWQNLGEIPGNGIDDDQNGFVDDVNGWDFYNHDRTVYDSATIDEHGTHVAGTIGAVGNNGVGVVGVNWHVKIMPLKFLGSANGTGPTSAAIAAINYARQMKLRGVNIRVLNNSWGGTNRSQALADAIDSLNQVGILFVTAAGNDGQDNYSDPNYPASYELPNILSVAATNQSDNRAYYSNRSNRLVQMMAPGDQILSTTPNNSYSYFSGTSMATPQVTGTAALMLAAKPDASMHLLRSALIYSGEFKWWLDNDTVTGNRLNAYQSILSVQENDTTPPAPAGAMTITSQHWRSLEVYWTAPGDDGLTGSCTDYDFYFTDSAPGSQPMFLPSSAILGPAGTQQHAFVQIPWRHADGTLTLRSYDNAGNFSDATVPVHLYRDLHTDPYISSTSTSTGLSTGGDRLLKEDNSGVFQGDDSYRQHFNLPFEFSFFGTSYSSVNVSSNGALYFAISSPLPTNDADSSIYLLRGQSMIAGLWDDLVIDTTARPNDGVYVVRPDADRIIFRWQAAKLSNSAPVNFEIELRSNGEFSIRYGEGNTGLFPVVGISGGEPDPYLIDAYTSKSSPINLTNADSLNFSLRAPLRIADLNISTVRDNDFVVPGQQITYRIDFFNNGPDEPPLVFLRGHIPVGTTFEYCTPFCDSAVDANGNIVLDFPHMSAHSGRSLNIVVRVTASPGAIIQNTTTVSSDFFDPNPSDNSTTSDATQVLQELVVAAPEFSPTGGTFGAPISVVLTCATPYAGINYTTNGVDPTPQDALVSSGVAVRINRTLTLKAKAFRLGWTPSAVTTTNFVIAPNPIDDPRNFTHQQYLDFLGRAPDQGGWDYWTGQLTACGSDLLCMHQRRIGVSAAFFVENEFQRTGYVVYRLHRAALGTWPSAPRRANLTFDQFMSDRSHLVDGPGLPQSTIDFANVFVQRPEFLAVYPASFSNSQFVDKLFDTAGLTPYTAERQQQIDAMNSGKTRAQVLLDVIEIPEFKTREYDRAFVLMQYFGYLRRDPDQGGYDFWLDILLNRVPNNYRSMVCAFLTSAEYQQRFGAAITRSNQDCAQQ